MTLYQAQQTIIQNNAYLDLYSLEEQEENMELIEALQAQIKEAKKILADHNIFCC